MNRFVQVNFAFPGPPRVRDLEPVFTSFADDWIRFSPYCWIIWTAKSTPEIYSLVRSHIAGDDQVLIAPIVADDVFGSMAPWIWGWMASKDPSIRSLLGAGAESALQALNAKYGLPLNLIPKS